MCRGHADTRKVVGLFMLYTVNEGFGFRFGTSTTQRFKAECCFDKFNRLRSTIFNQDWFIQKCDKSLQITVT